MIEALNYKNKNVFEPISCFANYFLVLFFNVYFKKIYKLRNIIITLLFLNFTIRNSLQIYMSLVKKIIS